jgi:isoamylase
MYEIKNGKPDPLGTTIINGGTNFSIFSKNATRAYLYIFKNFYDTKPLIEFEFDSILNRTGDTWHVWIKDIKEGYFYGYRFDGPYSPEIDGSRFNIKKFLIDPYAKAVTSSFELDMNDYSIYGYDKYSEYLDLSFNNIDSLSSMPKGIIINDDSFDWENDKRPNLDPRDRIIYEVHVRGFTKNKNSKVSNPGTFEGFLEKLNHLKELGITSVELLPVFAFNPQSITNLNPLTKERLFDYWGYNPLSFFSVAGQYTSGLGLEDQINSFKRFVKQLHKNNFEVILDVVYNHTGEGNELGPTVNFRGIDNSIYYMLENNPRYYKNYSGCGNTLNCNHPIVKRLIIDSLRYWYVDMHVDGFRFDLAAILGRAPNGNWVGDLSLLNDIANDRILSKAHLIAEGWDAAGGYFIGEFPKGWSEWNGKFRDTIRIMVKGEHNLISDLATRMSGSSDLYGNGRKPYNSINFITCHDGFTLWDLVSYEKKHNEANGLNNTDGSNDNHSFNCGFEGETDNIDIINLRKKMVRNFITILMLSQGTPMILSGDEFLNTQFGNNNAYCQDNEISWIDWSLKEKNKDIFQYFKKMIDFRKNHCALRRKHFFEGQDHSNNSLKDINWYSRDGNVKNWSDGEKTLSFIIDGHRKEIGWDYDDDNILVIMNFENLELPFIVPEHESQKWYLVLDTSVGFADNKLIESNALYVSPKSILILVSRNG